jgi:hypothetical protein
MLDIIRENGRFYENEMAMNENPYIEGSIFDVQKSPMKYYNGLIKDDFIQTVIDFKNGGGIYTNTIGTGFYKIVNKYLLFSAFKPLSEIDNHFENMAELYGMCEGLLVRY